MPLISSFSTVAEMFGAVTSHYRNNPRDVFQRKVDGVYVGTSYQELYSQVEAFALSLRALGLSHGDRVGIMSENRLEWIITDFACVCSGFADVPIFPILTPAQVEYVFNNAGAKVVVCSNSFQLNKLLKVADNIPTLECIIVMQEEAVEKTTGAKPIRTFANVLEEGRKLAEAVPGQLEQLIRQVKPGDLLTLIYTSGTTGNPKGVMLTHSNFVSNITGSAKVFPIGETDVVLSYLPLCHSYERTAGYYTCFACGATIAFADSIETVAENLQEVRPTLMTSVPRLFERIKNRVERGVQAKSDRDKKIFEWGMNVGKERFRRQQQGKRIGPILKAKNAIADKLVFAKIRERTGGRLRFFVSAGAALPYSVGEFFFAVGLVVVEGYGLTESSPVIAVNPYSRPKLGTVGPPIPNVEVKIAEDGEILARGGNIMKGYYGDEIATCEAINADGWLHTGDIGVIDEDGYLKITDRKKHLFVSSGGKNIAPGPIEDLLSGSRFVDQIMLIGNDRPFITALIVPNFDVLKEVAQELGLPVGNIKTEEGRKELIERDDIAVLVERDIKRLQRDLAGFERVRRFELLGEAFTVENGMMTPTLKVKRKEVEKTFAELIEGMYAGVEMD